MSDSSKRPDPVQKLAELRESARIAAHMLQHPSDYFSHEEWIRRATSLLLSAIEKAETVRHPDFVVVPAFSTRMGEE